MEGRRKIINLIMALGAVALGFVAQGYFSRHRVGDALIIYSLAAFLFILATRLVPESMAIPSRKSKAISKSKGMLGLSLVVLAVVASLSSLHYFGTKESLDYAWLLHVASIVLLLAALYIMMEGETWKLGITRWRIVLKARGVEIILLGLILLLAAFLRIHNIGSLPYGLWFDEAEYGLTALRVLEDRAYRPVYDPTTHHPTMFSFLIAASFKLAGVGVNSLRLVNVFIGLSTILVFYLLLRLQFDSGIALAGTFLLAVSRWHINFSRIALIGITAPLFEVLVLYFLFKAIRSGRPFHYAVSGVSMGFGLCSFTAYRLFPLVVGIFLLHRALTFRGFLKSDWHKLAIFLVATMLVIAPVIQYILQYPKLFWRRTTQTSIFRDKAWDEAIKDVKESVKKHVLMFNYKGDANGRHNLPGEPMLDFYSSILALLGFAYALCRWRKPGWFLPTYWLLIMLSAGIFSLAFEAPQSYRAIGSLPAIYLLVCMALDGIWREYRRATEGRSGKYFVLLLTLLLAVIGYKNYHTYFVRQAHNSAVWNSFSTIDTAVAYYVSQLGRERYRLYLQNQGTPAFRFLVRGPDRRLDERFFKAIDHLPIRERSDKDVVYILEPWRVSFPRESFLHYYPRGVYQEIEDPFGRTIFFSFSVKKDDVSAIQGVVGRYHVGGDSTGEPQLTRRDATIAFDWGRENPLGQGPFSVAWEGTIFIPQSGTYALGTRSAGRSQVRIDEELIVDNPGQRGGEARLVEGSLTAAKGWHSLEINCLDCAGGPMELYWRAPGKEPEIVPQETLCTVPSASNGLLGSYYSGTDWTGLPAFEEVDPIISFRWHDDPLPVPWCAQWEGKIRLQEGGEYRFRMQSNDYAALYINGERVVEYPSTQSSSIRLEAGEHEILVKYRNTKSYSEMRLLWMPPGSSSPETIPTKALFPSFE